MIDVSTSAFYTGDCRELLRQLPPASVQTCITSPPYWGLRDYGTGRWEGGDPTCDHVNRNRNDHSRLQDLGSRGTQRSARAAATPMRKVCSGCGASRVDRQIGLEQTPKAYVAELVKVLRLVWRALRDDGTLWLNLGDSYSHGGCGSRDDERWPKQGRNRGSHALSNGGNAGIAPVHAKKRTGLKPKDLVGIPWMVAFALRDAGWYLRSDIIWAKPNPMPESVTDRPTKSHEYLFLLAKSESYYYDCDAIREPLQPKTLTTFGSSRKNRDIIDPNSRVFAQGLAADVPVRAPRLREDGELAGANKRDVWVEDEQFRLRTEADVDAGVPSSGYRSGNSERSSRLENGGVADTNQRQPFGVPWEDTDGLRNKRDVWTVGATTYTEAHFATFPPKLIDPCVLAGSRVGDVVLDPFFGSGTVGEVAEKHGRRWIGFDLNPEYAKLQAKRTAQRSLVLG